MLQRISILLIFSLISSAIAEVKIHSSIIDKSFYIGEPFIYEILIDGASKVVPDENPESNQLHIKMLEVTQGSAGSPTSIALRYKIVPTQPGHITLPVFGLEADGAAFMTEGDEVISVGKPESLVGLKLSREIPDTPVYVGQAFAINYQWQSPLPLIGFRAVEFTLPLFHSSDFSMRAPHAWIDGDDKAAIGLPVSNNRLIARHSSQVSGKSFLNFVSFKKIFIAKSAGEKSVAAATLLASYVDPPDHLKRVRGWRTNYPSYFNNNFFEAPESEEYKKFFTASPSKSIQVLALPESGKPQDFLGQVGSRKVTVEAQPKVVAVGDPITLTIKVSECTFPEAVELPALNDQLSYSRQFSIPHKKSIGRIQGNTITYIRTLRPKSQDVSSIPSIRLPYFDPLTKSYQVAESAAIPITVKAAEVATAYDAQISGARPLRNLLESNDQGITANISELDSITGSSKSKTLWWLASSLLPPLGFLCFFLATRKKRLETHHPVRARANNAYHHFQKNIKLAEQLSGQDRVDHINRSVRTYFADKFNLTAMAHSFHDLEAFITDVIPAKSKQQLESIYQNCEMAHYRANSKLISADDLQTQLIPLISTIEKSLKA